MQACWNGVERKVFGHNLTLLNNIDKQLKEVDHKDQPLP
jgi:hypothetical protein